MSELLEYDLSFISVGGMLLPVLIYFVMHLGSSMASVTERSVGSLPVPTTPSTSFTPAQPSTAEEHREW